MIVAHTIVAHASISATVGLQHVRRASHPSALKLNFGRKQICPPSPPPPSQPHCRLAPGRSTPSIQVSNSRSNTSASPPSRASSRSSRARSRSLPTASAPTARSRPRASTRASPSATRTCALPTFSTPISYPEITFKSTAIRPLDDEDVRDRGRPHDPRRHATADAATRPLEGTETDPQGNHRVGLSASAQINRSRLRHEVQHGARLRQRRRRRQGQDPARHLRRQGLASGEARWLRLRLHDERRPAPRRPPRASPR